MIYIELLTAGLPFIPVRLIRNGIMLRQTSFYTYPCIMPAQYERCPSKNTSYVGSKNKFISRYGEASFNYNTGILKKF